MSTNWRQYGAIPYETWRTVITTAGGPAELAARAAYDATGDHSALCLAMLGQESSYATDFAADPPENLNPLNLRPRGGAGFMAFPSYAACINEWRNRLLDPTYRYAETVTLADLIHVYAPSSDHNNEAAYVAGILTRFARWGVDQSAPEPRQPVTFGRVPAPPIITLICAKAGEGHGYFTVPPRQNVGICEHITDGRGSVEFYHDFFSIGGERADDALVDFVIGRDGRIAMLNDWRGTRAPVANGNTAGLEGDGPAFLNLFGGTAVNSRLVSIEHEGVATEDWTGAQWNASVALDAWLFDQMGVRYDSFPVNQQFGIVTHLFHSEFTDKGGNALDECPGRYLKRNIDRFQTEIRAVLMAHQIAPPQSVPTVPWGKDATGMRLINGVKALAFYGAVTAKEVVTVRATASPNGKVIATLAAGDTAVIRGTVRNSRGSWALIDLGTKGVGRALLSDFVEQWPVI